MYIALIAYTVKIRQTKPYINCSLYVTQTKNSYNRQQWEKDDMRCRANFGREQSPLRPKMEHGK